MTVSIDGTEQLHLAVLQLARCSFVWNLSLIVFGL